MAQVLHDTWRQCYSQGWPQGLILPEAFAHPAKFSYKLIERIYAHARAEGWLPPGSVVLDPFAGVALGALHCLKLGCAWVGNELEPRFYDLGCANIAKWLAEYRHLPGFGPWAMLTSGDSRKLTELLPGLAQCVVSSPPWGDQEPSHAQGDTPSRQRLLDGATGGRTFLQAEYGTTPGQLATLPTGSVDGVVSSPPYSGNEKHDYRITDAGGRDRDVRRGHRQGLGCFRGSETYGHTPGQLGHMADGDVTLAVTSPPYADGCTHTGGPDPHPEHVQGGAVRHVAYGGSVEQLSADTDTFWSAAYEVISQTFALLRPGAHAIFVVKSYVRGGKLVDFPGDWARLCEAVGFTLLHEHHALLVEDHGTQTGLFGEDTVHQTERKSFFRRLSEKRGSPKINHETVLCFVKPCASGSGIAACVTSPLYSGNEKSDYLLSPDGKTRRRDMKRSYRQSHGCFRGSETYGQTDGQLGAMPSGDAP